MNDSTLALHFKYCAAIALLVIIAIATERWSANPQFTVYLSNAATMTSLLLGVIAIFYSFVSNDSLSRSLGSINTISSEVQGARQQIGSFVELSKESANASTQNAASLKIASLGITSSLASLDETLQAISGQNDAMRELLAALPSRIDQLESKVGDFAKSLGEKPPQAQPTSSSGSTDISARAIEHFLARASLSQNLLTYACVLAAQSRKPLSIESFCKAIALNAPSNFNGFIGCMNSIELIDKGAVPGQEKVYSVSEVHPELASQTKEYVGRYIDRAYSNKPMERLAWQGKLGAVEALFA